MAANSILFITVSILYIHYFTVAMTTLRKDSQPCGLQYRAIKPLSATSRIQFLRSAVPFCEQSLTIITVIRVSSLVSTEVKV